MVRFSLVTTSRKSSHLGRMGSFQCIVNLLKNYDTDLNRLNLTEHEEESENNVSINKLAKNPA